MSTILQVGKAITKEKAASACKKISKEEMEKLRKEDSKLVKGVFRCHEPRGGSVSFNYRKWSGDPVRFYTFYDGLEYEIPVGVAKHLNSNCGYEQHGHILDAQGNPIVDKRAKVVSRMNFESMDFYS